VTQLTGDIRVAEVSERWGLGGTEQAIEVRSNLLSRMGFDVTAVGVEGGGPRLDRLAATGVRTADCAGDWARFREALRAHRPHIVHYSRGATVSAFVDRVQDEARALSIPIVIETNVFGRAPQGAPPRPPDLVAHMSLASMLRLADAVGVSMTTLRADNHCVVYLPVPTSHLDGGPRRDAARAALSLDTDAFVACRVARPDIRKWSVRLECALGDLFAEVPRLRLVLMAAPEEKRRALERRFPGRVICLPPSSAYSDIARLYAASDFMLHSSGIGESFGLSVAEAMYCALPVVVDSTPAVDNAQVELVDHERTGLVVRSCRGFVDASATLARSQELRRTLGEAGKSKAIERFSDTVVAAQWARVYAEHARRAGVACRLDGEASETVPGPDEYGSFEREYRLRCSRTLGPEESLTDRWRCGALRAVDTLRYARQVGPRTVARVVSSRLRAGRAWHRD